MSYFVERGGREYGPYTEADIRRYLASGELSPRDRFRAESEATYRFLGDAVTVPGVARIPPGAFLPAYQRPQMANGAPLPPDLHWAVVLLLSVVTCGFFSMLWMLMQAWWLKQLHRGNRAIWILTASFTAGYLGSIMIGVVSPFIQPHGSDAVLKLEQALAYRWFRFWWLSPVGVFLSPRYWRCGRRCSLISTKPRTSIYV